MGVVAPDDIGVARVQLVMVQLRLVVIHHIISSEMSSAREENV
jgi:hypothetical protein